MYKNYRVVVNTAAGRRRYMQYLIPYVLSSDIVDRYDIWVNTHNGADIEFFKQVAAKFPVVNLVWQPDGVVNGNASINAFYKDCGYKWVKIDVSQMGNEEIKLLVRIACELEARNKK